MSIAYSGGMPRLLLRPGYILAHIAVIAIAVGLVSLGLWQLDRHAEAGEVNVLIERTQASAAVPLDQALEQDEVSLLPATVTGTYAVDDDVRLSPRSRNQRPGFEVLTPLRLPDGQTLMVNRGWVPLDEPIPPAPAGEVSLRGRLQLPLEARQVLPVGGDTAELVSNPDLGRLAGQVPGLIQTAYLEVIDEPAREAGVLPRPAEPIPLDAGNHLFYAMQWFAFAVIGLVGYPLLLRRVIVDGRGETARTRSAGPPAPDGDGGDGRPSPDVEAHPVSQ
ncbi:SURF1 family protein [soil metagenome]